MVKILGLQSLHKKISKNVLIKNMIVISRTQASQFRAVRPTFNPDVLKKC